MTTRKCAFKVTTDAARWWVALEPVDVEFMNPNKELIVDLAIGVDHAVVYYVEGASGEKFKLTAKAGSELMAEVDREIGVKGFAYGHKGFKP